MTNVSMAQIKIVEILRGYFQREALSLGVEMAFLYGSWAAGFPRPDSDVDIAIVFDEEGIEEDVLFEQLTSITVDLIRLLSREANVIPIYRDFRKPMLYYNAIVKGIPVFFSDFQRYIALFIEAIYHMEDFQIFGREWLIAVATKNLEESRHA
jgi:predicted nucleotidyltransferase